MDTYPSAWAPEPFPEVPLLPGGPDGPGPEPGGHGPVRANIARVYDAWLGGKDNYSVDRALAAEVAERTPWVPAATRANRDFLVRVVEFLTRAGVGQFLDIGTGLPTARNVHEVARDIVPDVRVVYVDNDPVVHRHAQALLAGQDGVSALRADARDPASVLEQASGAGGLDLSRPVGVLFVAVLHFLTRDDDPAGVVGTFRDALPAGSFLAVSHATGTRGRGGAAMREAVRVYREQVVPVVPRDRAEILRLFDGWELVPPGLVGIDRWQPVTERRGGTRVPVLGGVARSPARPRRDAPGRGGPVVGTGSSGGGTIMRGG